MAYLQRLARHLVMEGRRPMDFDMAETSGASAELDPTPSQLPEFKGWSERGKEGPPELAVQLGQGQQLLVAELVVVVQAAAGYRRGRVSRSPSSTPSHVKGGAFVVPMSVHAPRGAEPCITPGSTTACGS